MECSTVAFASLLAENGGLGHGSGYGLKFHFPSEMQLLHFQWVYTGTQHWCKIYWLQIQCTNRQQIGAFSQACMMLSLLQSEARQVTQYIKL